jgi:lipopolysaccharide cholinephosphotransferase
MQSNIELLHNADLAIVKEVVKICEEHNLTYYMLGGTQLGAIRHKGYIPWDDDIDLGMPREDYEKFLEIAPALLSKALKIVNYRNDLEYHYYITRILDTDSKVVETRYAYEGKSTNLSIDIFPLDGSPNNPILRKLFFFRVMYHRALMALHYKKGIDPDRKRGFAERLVLFFFKLLPTDKMFDAYKQKVKIDKLLRKYSVWDSEISGNIMGAYRTREMVPTEWLGGKEGKMYDFEDIKLRGYKDYDKYLSHLYGDYMQLPPEGSRKIHFKLIEIHGEKLD